MYQIKEKIDSNNALEFEKEIMAVKPTEIDNIYDFGDGDEVSKTLFDYTFENGVPVKCTRTDDGTPESYCTITEKLRLDYPSGVF